MLRGGPLRDVPMSFGTQAFVTESEDFVGFGEVWTRWPRLVLIFQLSRGSVHQTDV